MSEWKIPSLTALSDDLQNSENSAAGAKALELIRNARRELAYKYFNSENTSTKQAYQYVQDNAQKLSQAIPNIIHRNMLVGLLSECKPQELLYLYKNENISSLQIIQDSWKNGELSRKYCFDLTNQIAHNLLNQDFHFSVSKRAYIDC